MKIAVLIALVLVLSFGAVVSAFKAVEGREIGGRKENA
jgi:hypothetical protein